MAPPGRNATGRDGLDAEQATRISDRSTQTSPSGYFPTTASETAGTALQRLCLSCAIPQHQLYHFPHPGVRVIGFTTDEVQGGLIADNAEKGHRLTA